MLRLALVLCLIAAPALARENYALLIGASSYPSLDEKYWLKGPANDVRLVQTYLTTEAPVPFAEKDVIVLADGVEGAAAPTLAGIRAAFADLAARVQPGDFVYLHFSGHGSQAPALDPETELDGLDELFMPADIGPWQDEIGAVQNALVDDEIGTLIDGLRAKGANVWAVFDSCHSGTVTRGVVEEDVRMRQLPADALGIPAEEMAVASRALPDPRASGEAPFDQGAKDGMGSFVAFFAAQTTEVTPEKNLPKGKPGRMPQGVFTWSLFQVLAEYPGATYGQIGQEVLRKYATSKIAHTTPMFEGDLGQVAFSGTPTARVAQWTATPDGDGFTIPAGSLHGLAEGEVLAVMGSAADPDSAALGFVTLTGVDTFAARATATADKPLPQPLPKAVLLRRTASDVDFTLTVALPADAPALQAALPDLKAAAGPRLLFVAAGQEADLQLAMLPDSPRPDAVWVLPGSGLAGDLAGQPSVSTQGKTPAELGTTLADTLTTMARAINLQKLGAAVGPGALDVDVALLTGPDKNDLTEVVAASVPRLIPEDQVHILARNNMDQPVDVNVLYIGADYAISHWFAGRLQPGDRLKKGLFKIGDASFGDERMIVVVTPAKPQSPVEDLAFLAQDSLDTTRGFGGSALSAALAEAGFGQTTRSAAALDDDDSGPEAGIIEIEVQTVPAD